MGETDQGPERTEELERLRGLNRKMERLFFGLLIAFPVWTYLILHIVDTSGCACECAV